MGNETKVILGFVPDLFFSTRIGETAKHLGYTVAFAKKTDDLLQKARDLSPVLLIVDLTPEGINLEGPLIQLRLEAETASIPLLAFTTHAAWRQTAPLHRLCNQVVTKEALTRDLPTLLRKYLEEAA
jgi:DNA-binding response OmpR family regulator